MKVRTKSSPMKSASEQQCGCRIGPNGEVEVLSRAETTAIIRRAIYDSIVKAGFRIPRTLH
jgi:hypothetical protein